MATSEGSELSPDYSRLSGLYASQGLSQMTGLFQTYYLFLGFHGFLLGLFPFFIPVYLYKNGTLLPEITLFVAFSGIGFILTQWCWDRLRSGLYRPIIIASLLLEVLLVFSIYLEVDLTIVALLNGGYNCLYWMIQRILFFSAVSPDNSGRNFGNFQIFVLVMLKAGIFIGSISLGDFGIIVICFLSFIIACAAVLVFSLRAVESLEVPADLRIQKPIGLLEIVSFKDRCFSRLVFIIDGVFLYLESYFWLISLFIFVGESFVKLGLVVIVLALLLGCFFLLIKNRIDRLPVQRVYGVAVSLYALSWGIRGMISGNISYTAQICLIVLVAFCTSFFRLAFNKRFFDFAGLSTGYKYIFIKSYYSQFFLACVFFLLAVILRKFSENGEHMHYIYWMAAGFAFLYLKYNPALQSSGAEENHDHGFYLQK